LAQRTWMVPLLISVAVLLSVGCGGDDDTPTGPILHNNKLVPDFYNMDSLPSGWLYQVWARKDGIWNAGQAFNLDASGKKMVDAQGQQISDTIVFALLDLTTCDSLRVTLQQNVATDSSTAGLTFLEGVIQGRVPEMSSPLKDTTVGNFVFFIYTTPTNDIDTDEMSGVWFTNLDHTTPGLEPLPVLPDGWIYEGWVYHDGYYLSTGRFSENIGSDNSCTYYNCGSTGAPDFPGEDFLTNAPEGLEFPFDLAFGDTVMVSLEPENDPYLSRPCLRWYVRPVADNHIPTMQYDLNGFNREKWPKIIASIAE